LNKHKMGFESVSDDVWNSFDKELQIDLGKYRRVRRDEIKFDKEIDKLNEKIKEYRERKKKYNKILTHLYDKINHIKDDFLPIVNIVGYNKKSDGMVYWNVNVKFKKKLRSWYLGKDDKIREILYKNVGVGLKVKKDTIKKRLEFYLREEIMDYVIDNKMDFENIVIDRNELLGMIKK